MGARESANWPNVSSPLGLRIELPIESTVLGRDEEKDPRMRIPTESGIIADAEGRNQGTENSTSSVARAPISRVAR